MKLTKKSYNRRVYTFGIMIFTAIALISTGFATWVMSTNAQKEGNGDITVGTITESSLSFSEIVNVGDKKFSFEPLADDKVGEVRWDGTNSENLTVTFSGSVSPVDWVEKISVEMTKVPEGVLKAHEEKYIVLPECYTSYHQIDPETKKETRSEVVLGDEHINKTSSAVEFTYPITIEWGTKFGGENPSKYLDEAIKPATETEEARPYTYQEKLDELIKFRRMIYSLPEVPNGSSDTDATFTDKEVMEESFGNLKFEIVFTAYSQA